MNKTYIGDLHYESSKMTIDDILVVWKEFHDSLPSDCVKQWKGAKNIEFPAPYTLPKDKDLNAFRPIVPYTKHQFKKALNFAGRCIAFMIKRTNTKNFGMYKSSDFQKTVSQTCRGFDPISYFKWRPYPFSVEIPMQQFLVMSCYFGQRLLPLGPEDYRHFDQLG